VDSFAPEVCGFDESNPYIGERGYAGREIILNQLDCLQGFFARNLFRGIYVIPAKAGIYFLFLEEED